MGGDRHHPLVVAVADELATGGVTALRVDLPEPDLDLATAQLAAAAAAASLEAGCDEVVLVGYSWGAAVTARTSPVGLVARVLVAPPAPMLPGRPVDAVPTLVLVPAHDQYGPPDQVRAAVGDWPGVTVEVVDGCDHFLVGAVARIAQRATTWLTDQL
jgi:pimeloyl-ACP methyl ester carboxylesterase